MLALLSSIFLLTCQFYQKSRTLNFCHYILDKLSDRFVSTGCRSGLCEMVQEPFPSLVVFFSLFLPPPSSKPCVAALFSATSDGLVKVKVEVYSLVSSAKRHSPDFTPLPPGHRTCSFISRLNSPGSIQAGSHFWRTKLFQHTSLHCPTRYPLTPGSRECTCRQSALPRSTTSSEHNSV